MPGLFGGGGNDHTTTTVEPPAWVRPLIEGAGHDIINTVHGNAGNLQNLSNSLSGMLPGLQSQVMDPTHLQGGFNYANDVLSGHYLGQDNPYLNQMVQQTGQNVGNQVNATFSAAGRTGGGANQQLLTKGLADSENALRYQNYSNERNNQTQAAALLPGLQQAQTSGINSLLGAYQTAGQLPYYGAQTLSGLGSLFGGYSNTRAENPSGGGGGDIMNLIGSLGSAAILASDRRLKKNIVKLGEASDGLGIYEWEYNFDPSNTRCRGVMADEVEKLRPHAFVPNFRGEYSGVNYAVLGDLS